MAAAMLALAPWGPLIPIALAQSSSSSSAKALFEAGVVAAREGDLERAGALFAHSAELESTPNTLLNLAIVWAQLGRPLDALTTLDAFDGLPQEEEDADRRTKAAKLRTRVEAQIAILEPVISPASARVLVDGVSPPLRGRLLPGRHTVQAEAQGYEPAEWIVELSAAQRVRLEKTLEPTQVTSLPPPPLPAAPPVVAAPVSRTDPPVEVEPDRGTRRKRWRVALIVASAVAAAAVGTVIAVSATRGEESSPPKGETPFE